MESTLVIGCNKCFQEIKRKRGYLINHKGMMEIFLPVHTAYTVNDLYELFMEHYSCPYCGRTLKFTHQMMGFANDYIDKNYHIDFSKEHIEIRNNKEQILIPKNADQLTLNKLLNGKETNIAPSIEEAKEILDTAKHIDSSIWTFRIESKSVDPFFHKVMPEFDKDDYYTDVD